MQRKVLNSAVIQTKWILFKLVVAFAEYFVVSDACRIECKLNAASAEFDGKVRNNRQCIVEHQSIDIEVAINSNISCSREPLFQFVSSVAWLLLSQLGRSSVRSIA